MSKILLGIASTTAIIFIIPFIVYAIFSAVFNLKPPEGISPAKFLTSILISKIGTAIMLSLIYYYAKDIFQMKWILFAVIIWIMFVFGEIGQAIGPNYSWKEAIAGIISETIYVPLSIFVLRLIIK